MSIDAAALAPLGRYRVGSVTKDCIGGTFSLYPGSATPLCTGPCQPGGIALAAIRDRCSLFSASGRFGKNRASPNASCVDSCPEGRYCPPTTVIPPLCPAGRFGSSRGLSAESCTGACATGFYCEPGSQRATSKACPPGRFGATEKLTDSKCSGECQAGYFCPAASSARDQLPCGSNAVYCEAGVGQPRAVAAGFESIGGTNETRSAVRQCELGRFCEAGVSVACRQGEFSDRRGVSVCSACPSGRFGENL